MTNKILAAALFVVVFHTNVCASPQRRVALVVGNSGYIHVDALTNPRNDAALIARTLKSLGFELIGGAAQLDLDKSSFDSVIESFGRKIAGADVALFYYAGHGVQVHGVNWLVPITANVGRIQDLDFQMIDAGLVLRQMDGAGTRLNIMILDACRNNPYGDRGLRGLSSGLAEMKVPEGTIISYATQPDSVAEDGTGADSPYSAALAAAMLKPGLNILDMFNAIGRAVKLATNKAQQPWYSASPIDGDFFFAGSVKEAGTEIPPAARKSYQSVTADRIPSRSDVQEALQALREGDVAKIEGDLTAARARYELAASLGNSDAMAKLGFVYIRGEGGPVLYSKAEQLFQRAVAVGNVRGEAGLGFLSMAGTISATSTNDFQEAKIHCLRGAAIGDPEAENCMSIIYANGGPGKGVDKDPNLAEYWNRRAARDGDPYSAWVVGIDYLNGTRMNGTPAGAPDRNEARYWLRKAADLGFKEARSSLEWLDKHQ